MSKEEKILRDYNLGFTLEVICGLYKTNIAYCLKVIHWNKIGKAQELQKCVLADI